MNTTRFFRNATKNTASVIFFFSALGMLGLFAWGIWGLIHGMSSSESDEEYYYYFSDLVGTVGALVFTCLFFIMLYLIYINKQFTKWCVWLFYLLGATCLVYFIVSGEVYEHLFSFANQDNIQKIAVHARRLLNAPAGFMIVCFSFLPKIIKDATKLKEEQELTI